MVLVNVGVHRRPAGTGRMGMQATTRAQVFTDEEPVRFADPFRYDLLALCYRMLGALPDAQDAVEDTYRFARRAGEHVDSRAALRPRLYRAAVRACLAALDGARRRPLPSGLGGPSDDPAGPIGASLSDLPWLQPFPTALAGEAGDPAAVGHRQASLRLPLVAALQQLPPRQRAVVILRDVLDWRSAEVAQLLDTSVAAMNSLLQRGRAQLDHAGLRAGGPAVGGAAGSGAAGGGAAELVDRYAAAFENADLAALAGLLTEDAVWEMPPFATWFAGREMIGRFLATRLPARGHGRLVRTSANGQPAFASYRRYRHGTLRVQALQVLSTAPGGVDRIVAFHDPAVFRCFGLPVIVGG
jgi:RNA polymerase sigma-70 factor, ECF subfamily